MVILQDSEITASFISTWQEHANTDVGGQPNKQPNGKHLALGAYVATKLGPKNAHGRHVCILKLGEVQVSMRIIEVAVSRRRRRFTSKVMVTPGEHQGNGYARRLMYSIIQSRRRFGIEDNGDFVMLAKCSSKVTRPWFVSLRDKQPPGMDIAVAFCEGGVALSWTEPGADKRASAKFQHICECVK